MNASLVADEVRAALSAAEDADATPAERAEMLMEIAMGLQQRRSRRINCVPRSTLYDKALTICPDDERLLRARIPARKATALQAIPEAGHGFARSRRAPRSRRRCRH